MSKTLMDSDMHRQQWISAGGNTPDHWDFYTIEDLLLSTKSISVGVMYPGGHHENGIPLIRVADVIAGSVFKKPDFCISDEVNFEYRRTQLTGDELLITLVGTPGDCVVVRPSMKGWNVARALAVLKLKQPELRPWLRYLLTGGPAKHLIDARLNTTVQKTLNLKDIKELGVPIPSDAERRHIVEIISSLDDKIELNRRMTETLEAMARAIFQSWFVDFDPVRAKASGESSDAICQRLGLTPELLALFPASFEDSELGEIPKGWKINSLSDLSSYLSRGISPKYLEEGGVCVLNQKCIRDGKVSTASARRHDPAQRSIAGRELATGDILVNSTGTGTLGRVAQLMALDEPTIVDSHVTVVRANPIACAASYLSLTLMGRQAEIEALGEGSTGQTELSRARLAAFKILVPPIKLMNIFDERVKAFREASSRNDRQSAVLAVIRDALLPKLLSGELEVQKTAA